MASFYNALRSSGLEAGKKFLLTPKKLEEITKSAKPSSVDENKLYYERMGHKVGRAAGGSTQSILYRITGPDEITKIGSIEKYTLSKGEKIGIHHRIVKASYKFNFEKTAEGKTLDTIQIKKDGKIFKILHRYPQDKVKEAEEIMKKPVEKTVPASKGN